MRTSLPRTDGQCDVLALSARSPQQDQEVYRLPRATQLPPIMGSAFDPPMTIANEVWTPVPSPIGPRPSNGGGQVMGASVWKRFLVVSAVFALVVGYLGYRVSDGEGEIALQSPSLPSSHLPVSEESQPTGLSNIIVEGRVEPELQTNLLQPIASPRSPIGIETDAKSPQPVPSIESRAASDEMISIPMPNPPPQVSARAARADASFGTQNRNPEFDRKQDTAKYPISTCYSSASAVRQQNPTAWPSWTLRAPGHEGTRCWYPGTHSAAQDRPK
jgi:hypothetical protein